MGTEVVGEDISQVSVKDKIQEDRTCLQKLEYIEESNQGAGFAEFITLDEPITGDTDPATDVNTFPSDAIGECPLPKRIHSFYFVKLRPDRELKTIMDQAEENLEDTIYERFEISKAIKKYKLDQVKVISRLKSLNYECEIYRPLSKKKEMVWRKLRTVKNANDQKTDGDLCSSEEELNYIIRSLRCQLQHKNSNLVVGKRLLGEIKQLEGTREKFISNAAMTYDLFSQTYHNKLMDVEWKIRRLKDNLQNIDNRINTLHEKLTTMNQKRNAERESLNKLRKQQDKGNAYCYQNSLLLNNARELAVKKDIAALEELSCIEGEKFMSLWSSNKSFRDDYVKRTFASLDTRQLSRDGRTRNPDENPLVSTTELDSNVSRISYKVILERLERRERLWYYYKLHQLYY